MTRHWCSSLNTCRPSMWWCCLRWITEIMCQPQPIHTPHYTTTSPGWHVTQPSSTINILLLAHLNVKTLVLMLPTTINSHDWCSNICLILIQVFIIKTNPQLRKSWRHAHDILNYSGSLQISLWFFLHYYMLANLENRIEQIIIKKKQKNVKLLFCQLLILFTIFYLLIL